MPGMTGASSSTSRIVSTRLTYLPRTPNVHYLVRIGAVDGRETSVPLWQVPCDYVIAVGPQSDRAETPIAGRDVARINSVARSVIGRSALRAVRPVADRARCRTHDGSPLVPGEFYDTSPPLLRSLARLSQSLTLTSGRIHPFHPATRRQKSPRPEGADPATASGGVRCGGWANPSVGPCVGFGCGRLQVREGRFGHAVDCPARVAGILPRRQRLLLRFQRVSLCLAFNAYCLVFNASCLATSASITSCDGVWNGGGRPAAWYSWASPGVMQMATGRFGGGSP